MTNTTCDPSSPTDTCTVQKPHAWYDEEGMRHSCRSHPTSTAVETHRCPCGSTKPVG